MTFRVFVYGTLKSSGPIRGLDSFAGADFVAEAITVDAAYSLYDLGAFPAVSLNGTDRISGEVWEVNEEVMAKLDMIEGFPDFYNRLVVETTAGEAWMYFIPELNQDSLYPTASKIVSNSKKVAEWKHKHLRNKAA